LRWCLVNLKQISEAGRKFLRRPGVHFPWRGWCSPQEGAPGGSTVSFSRQLERFQRVRVRMSWLSRPKTEHVSVASGEFGGGSGARPGASFETKAADVEMASRGYVSGGNSLDESVLGPLASEVQGGRSAAGGGEHLSGDLAAAAAILDDGTPSGPPDRPGSRDRPSTRSSRGIAGSRQLSVSALPGEAEQHDEEPAAGSEEDEERRGLLSSRVSTARTERSAAEVSRAPCYAPRVGRRRSSHVYAAAASTELRAPVLPPGSAARGAGGRAQGLAAGAPTAERPSRACRL
jgi:hypothetical protein